MPDVIQTTNVQGFLDSFLSPEDKVAPQEISQQSTSPIQTALDSLNKKPEEAQVENKTEEGAVEGDKDKPALSKEELEKALNKGDENKKEEEEKLLVKDVTKFSEVLKEKNLLIPYEDGTLPSTEEELLDAIEQSSQFTVRQTVENAWKEKVESLPEPLLRIHEFAAKGVTTAQQVAQFTNALAQSEAIGALDPKVPEDQEQIVLLQLMNTGLDEKAAREEVADLKARNGLESSASRYFPALKKAYDENVRRQEIEQQEALEDQQRYIQANAANVTYFLEKDTDYLPFKIDNRDRQYKADIFNLAGQPVEIQEDGTPVFGWQKQIESLQYGTEQDYKKFMKVMAFLANDKKFEEGLSKKVASKEKVNEFKKIAGGAQNVNTLSTEQNPPMAGIKKKSSGSWGLV